MPVEQGQLGPVDDGPDEHLQDQVDGAVGVQGTGEPARDAGEVRRAVGGLLQPVLDVRAPGRGQQARAGGAGALAQAFVLPGSFAL